MTLTVFPRRRTRRWGLFLVLAAAGLAGLYVLAGGDALLRLPFEFRQGQRAGGGGDEDEPLAGHLIALDAGHGGIDGGCSAGRLLEKDLALDIALDLRARLLNAGARAFLVRESDHDLSWLGEGSFRQRRDLSGRVSLVGRSGAEVFLSVHLNSALDPRLSGPITFYQALEAKPGGCPPGEWAARTRESRRLGELVQEELRALYPGCVERAWPHTFYLLRNSPCPTVLVEVGYLSNPSDRLRLADPEFRSRVAAALAQAIRRYFAGDKARR